MKLEAGRYWVGDLCYLITGPKWNSVCEFLGNGPEMREGVFTLDGRKGAIFGTAYGDGVYHDQEGNEYGVDSGTLGIFPAGLMDSKWAGLGTVFEFPEDFPVSCVDGEMRFGHIRIRTKGAARPFFKVKIRRNDGQVSLFDLDVVEDCYSTGSATLPGVRVSDPARVNEFVGDDFACEMIDMTYAEGGLANGDLEDEEGRIICSWEMVNEAGEKVKHKDIESMIFDHFLIRG